MAKTANKVPGFTTRQLMAGFQVSDMTVWAWRQGSAKRDPLPVVKEGTRVYFPETALKAWAKKYKLEFSATTAANALTDGKSGPKVIKKEVGGKVPVVKAKPVAKKSAEVTPKPVKAAAKPKTVPVLKVVPKSTPRAKASAVPHVSV